MNSLIAITLELSGKGGKRLSFLDLAYAECVKEAGGIPLHFPPLSSGQYVWEIVSRIDGLVLTGGADIHPSFYGEEISAPISLSPDQRTRFDIDLFRATLEAGKAILAICHGMQIMNVAFSGTLFQDLATQAPNCMVHRGKEERSPARHTVRVEPGSLLGKIMEGMPEFEVTSIHHQAVKYLGRGLKVSGRAPDGLVEAVELPGNPRVMGVQWHPEHDPRSEASKRLFQYLVGIPS